QTGNTRLKDQYIAYFEHRKMADEYLKLLTMMMDHLSPVFNGQTITLSAINGMMRNLKEDHEKKCKDFLRSWNALHVFDETPFKTTVVNFLGSEYRYFDGSRFIGNELVELNKIANESWQLVHKYIFSEFKKILTDQLRLVNKKEFQE
ncbi:MAG: hypothetical protein JSU05_16085, partial [Bacteroidetes bacterium]|nr:hypothetical protein [Bacteroidota bacterium]